VKAPNCHEELRQPQKPVRLPVFLLSALIAPNEPALPSDGAREAGRPGEAAVPPTASTASPLSAPRDTAIPKKEF